HDLCSEQEFLSKLAGLLRTNAYAPELAITAQVVIRRLRERGDRDYLVTAQAAARSSDISLVWSAAVAMCGVNYDSPNDDDFIILDELAAHTDRHVRET